MSIDLDEGAVLLAHIDSEQLAGFSRQLNRIHQVLRQHGYIDIDIETLCRMCACIDSVGSQNEENRSISAIPHWDNEDRTLWLGSRCLKRFTRIAPYQQVVLRAFQDQEWPQHYIENPFCEVLGMPAAKVQLRNTIKNLNRNLPKDAIYFCGVWKRNTSGIQAAADRKLLE